MKKRHVMAVAVVALVACFMLVGSVQAETYKMALSLAITGPTSDAGAPYSMGAEDYVKYANDIKLLGEDKIECDIRDDAYQTEATKRNFEEFLDKGIVIYLNYSTGSTLALKKDFDEERIATLPASYHAGNLEDSTYIFLPIGSYASQLIALADYVAQNHKGGTAKVALFVHPSAFGRAPADDVKKAVAAGLGIEIVEVVEHGKDLDNTAMIKRLLSKDVRYVISQTVQSPVATMIKDAERLGVVSKGFGDEGKLTFMGAHYTGGNDLIALAGSAAENFYWTTSFTLTSDPGAGADAQRALAKRYGRDEKTAESHNYTSGIMVAQVAVETIRRVKAKGLKVTRESLYEELNQMNGFNAYYPLTTVGPVNYSKTDREGVNNVQIYRAQNGVFKSVGMPFVSKYVAKLK